jgi:hypothetical protein
MMICVMVAAIWGDMAAVLGMRVVMTRSDVCSHAWFIMQLGKTVCFESW